MAATLLFSGMKDIQTGILENQHQRLTLFRVNKAIPMSYDSFTSSTKTSIRPVCLPWNRGDTGRVVPDGINLTVIGWGRVTNNRRDALENQENFGFGSNILQQIQLPKKSGDTCENTPLLNGFRKDHQLCAGGVQGNIIRTKV